MDDMSHGSASVYKSALRQQQKDVRAQCNAQHDAVICMHAVNVLFEFLPQVRTVGVYFPIHTEINIMPAAEVLSQRGCVTAMPVLQPDKSLIFSRWKAGDPAQFDEQNIPRPFGAMKPEEPDALLIPLLAFDNQGRRLGYGGGSYDRYLAHVSTHKKVLSIGIAYDEQQVTYLPAEPHDMPLDIVVTQKGALICPSFSKKVH